MQPTVRAGLVLGVLVFLWTLVVGITGWYKDPVLLNLFYLVILIQIGVLVWGLRLPGIGGDTYGSRVKAGTMISVFGAVIIFFGSLLFTTVFFPNYFEEVREAGRQALLAGGMPEAEVATTLEAQAAVQTPLMQALIGAVMTVITGFVVSLILAAIIRKK